VGFGGFAFRTNPATLNTGDHVTFVWSTGFHSATNGTDPVNDPEAGQIFDSGILNNASDAFTWKSDELGTIPYFCGPHWSGTDRTSRSAPPVRFRASASARCSTTRPRGRTPIEIANLGGDDAGDLGRYRIAINGTTSTSSRPTASRAQRIEPGRVVIHTNQTGTNTATDIYLNTIGDLRRQASVALHVPNSPVHEPPGRRPDHRFRAVGRGQPGELGHRGPRRRLACRGRVRAGGAAGNYDLAFCGAESQRGASFWDVAHPNFRSQALCATPTGHHLGPDQSPHR
jgi:hypothetical protein